MQFKNIDSLSITECCEHLNIKKEDLPKALQGLNKTTELDRLVIARLNLLLNEDETAFKSCHSIEEYKRYCAIWTDGLYNTKAAQIIREDNLIKQKVVSIIAGKLDVNPKYVVETAYLTNDLGADSLDIVELIMEFEKEFEITFSDDVAEKINTVGQIIEYIKISI